MVSVKFTLSISGIILSWISVRNKRNPRRLYGAVIFYSFLANLLLCFTPSLCSSKSRQFRHLLVTFYGMLWHFPVNPLYSLKRQLRPAVFIHNPLVIHGSGTGGKPTVAYPAVTELPEIDTACPPVGENCR